MKDEKTRISSFADSPSVVSLKVIMESASWNQKKNECGQSGDAVE